MPNVVYAMVSAMRKRDRRCVRQRFRRLLLGAYSCVLLTTQPNISNTTFLPQIGREIMPGMYGASHASRGSKKAFLRWAAMHLSSFDYIWHIEEDAVVDVAYMKYIDDHFSHDVIAPLFLQNPYYSQRCVLCKIVPCDMSFGWPVIRLSRNFVNILYETAISTAGHHEVLSYAACRVVRCRFMHLPNSSIRLAKSKKEHRDFVWQSKSSFAWHPVKCKHAHTITSSSSKNADGLHGLLSNFTRRQRVDRA